MFQFCFAQLPIALKNKNMQKKPKVLFFDELSLGNISSKESLLNDHVSQLCHSMTRIVFLVLFFGGD